MKPKPNKNKDIEEQTKEIAEAESERTESLEQITARTCIRKIGYIVCLENDVDTEEYEKNGCDKCIGYSAECLSYSPKYELEGGR